MKARIDMVGACDESGMPVGVVMELDNLRAEVSGFWTADWTDWREMCRFIAERLRYYASWFEQRAEAE